MQLTTKLTTLNTDRDQPWSQTMFDQVIYFISSATSGGEIDTA